MPVSARLRVQGSGRQKEVEVGQERWWVPEKMPRKTHETHWFEQRGGGSGISGVLGLDFGVGGGVGVRVARVMDARKVHCALAVVMEAVARPWSTHFGVGVKSLQRVVSGVAGGDVLKSSGSVKEECSVRFDSVFNSSSVILAETLTAVQIVSVFLATATLYWRRGRDDGQEGGGLGA
ncbi:hypothetical protein B0H16DRAFT_1474322 [Mycena metata]|uniref:Uncharacterized protein n=1 Tax=Mycena metata TaxID=1033252 RepID=A0AAD7HH26_9AGAR|nr:hypothetical protein B0H16DRAFT_1474322 [Mycena metata]